MAEVVGYGDPECSENCPFRNIEPSYCDSMVQATILQIEAAQEGDMDAAEVFERIQNYFWSKLLCEPGRIRA